MRLRALAQGSNQAFMTAQSDATAHVSVTAVKLLFTQANSIHPNLRLRIALRP